MMSSTAGASANWEATRRHVQATADFAGRVIEQMQVRVNEALVRRTKCDSFQTQGAVTLS